MPFQRSSGFPDIESNIERDIESNIESDIESNIKSNITSTPPYSFYPTPIYPLQRYNPLSARGFADFHPLHLSVTRRFNIRYTGCAAATDAAADKPAPSCGRPE